VLTLFGATLVTFVISHLVPADVARLIGGDDASPEMVARIVRSGGLDQPVWRQYLIYLDHLAHGDLGVSIRTGRPVLGELLAVLPATAELAFAAFAIILVFSLVLGSLAALERDRLADQVIRVLSALSISTPTFWLGLLLIALFSAKLGWLPLGDRLDESLTPAPSVTGLLTVDGLIAGRLDVVVDALRHLVLPAMTLAIGATGASTRLVRASLLEILSADYVRRARSAGFSEWVVLTRYALPNALVPFVTTMGLLLADLLGGAVVTEIIFGWPGVGAYTIDAIAGLDYPAIMGFTLFAAAVYALANMAVDVACGLLDPRAGAGR
jgi:peptide/nickel transport system permease protein